MSPDHPLNFPCYGHPGSSRRLPRVIGVVLNAEPTLWHPVLWEKSSLICCHRAFSKLSTSYGLEAAEALAPASGASQRCLTVCSTTWQAHSCTCCRKYNSLMSSSVQVSEHILAHYHGRPKRPLSARRQMLLPAFLQFRANLTCPHALIRESMYEELHSPGESSHSADPSCNPLDTEPMFRPLRHRGQQFVQTNPFLHGDARHEGVP